MIEQQQKQSGQLFKESSNPEANHFGGFMQKKGRGRPKQKVEVPFEEMQNP